MGDCFPKFSQCRHCTLWSSYPQDHVVQIPTSLHSPAPWRMFPGGTMWFMHRVMPWNILCACQPASILLYPGWLSLMALLRGLWTLQVSQLQWLSSSCSMPPTTLSLSVHFKVMTWLAVNLTNSNRSKRSNVHLCHQGGSSHTFSNEV